MKEKILLRIASLLMFLHLCGHMVGALTWKHTTDPLKEVVILQMTQPKFPFMGAMRSMGEFFDGYGYATAISLLLVAVLLWFASYSLQEKITKKLLIVCTLFLYALSIDEFLFFFPAAAIISLIAAVLTTFALFSNKRR